MKRIIDPAAAVTESGQTAATVVAIASRHQQARLTLGFADDAGTTRM
ncbi:urease accessory protein UreD, partial [Herbaspirillum sp. 3C11]